nr:MAG TPA: hypothetical protein [Caudoviricetes sp.]
MSDTYALLCCLLYLNSIVVHFIFIVKHFFWIFKIYFFLKKYIDRKQQSKMLQVSNINGLSYILDIYNKNKSLYIN